MTKKHQLDSSLPLIEFFFDNSSKKSFTEKKFSDIFFQNRYEWKVPSGIYAAKVLDYLLKRNFFYKNTFTDHRGDKKNIYSWKTQDEFTVISGLKHDSYYAYYSALYFHQLTLQIPKTIYLNFEHAASSISEETIVKELTQNAIDNAFRNQQRKSSATFIYKDKKIILTNGKYTNELGVVELSDDSQLFKYTDIERTLIDIVVRPVYAGGTFEVLEAFRIAKGKVDTKKMAIYLEKLNFTYPYHQAIGFYMERAGYNKQETAFFKKEMKVDFYLTYGIRNKEYSSQWKLFYPKGV